MMCLLGGLGSSSMAQETTVYIGQGVNKQANKVPFSTQVKHTTSQQLLTADVIKAANDGKMPKGKITKIAFQHYTSNTSIYCDNLAVYMIHTNLTELTASMTQNVGSALYSGSAETNSKTNCFEITLTTPFEYDGESNILLCLDVNSKPSIYSGDANFVTSSTGTDYGNYYSSVYHANNPTNYGPDVNNWKSGTRVRYTNAMYLTFLGEETDDTSVSPTTVSNVSPSNNYSYGSNPQKLTWTFGANTTQYQVLVGTEIDETTEKVVNTKGQQEFVEKGEGDNGSYSAEGLSAGTKYYWQVISKNENGETTGEIWNFTTVNAEPTAMVTKTYPENGASLKTSDVVLKWSYGNDEHVRYTIYLGESADEMEVLFTDTDDKTEYTPNNLQGEKTYYWRVDVNNAIYTSEDINVWSFTTQSVGNISGIVKFKDAEYNDVAVDGASITIYDKEGNKIDETTTDNNGGYEFTGIIVGDYDLVVEKNGYETYTIDVTVEGNETVSFDIYMPSVIKENGTWNTLNALSTEFNELIVKANAVLQSTAKVGSLTIEDGQSVTIKNGAVLTVVGEINNNGEIIIEDGGQIFQSNEGVQATFKMNVENPEEWLESNATGWQFIASPFADAATASFIPSEGNYDLYKYNGTKDLEWINYKEECASNGTAQPLVQIGEGEYYVDNYQKQAPLCDYYKYLASQTIYTAEEIGVEAGVVSSISYNLQSAYESTRSISIYMKNTERTESYSSWETLTSDLCVFSGEITYGATAGWFTIDLQNKFSYTGGNLLVTVIDNTGVAGSGNKFYSYETGPYTATTDIRTIYKNSGAYIDPLNITLGKSALTAVIGDNSKCLAPQIKLDFRAFVPFEESFVSGVGYIASYETEETATLSGNIFNKDNFTFKVFYNAEKDLANFHLLGNPFTFNMDWSKAQATGLATGYAVVNNEGGYDYLTTGTINVGDGFFVKAIAEAPTFSYDHKNVPVVTRNSKHANSINIIASGKAGKDNVIVNFAGKAEGFNKLQNFNDAIATVYVSENGKHYGIANVDENTTEVALNFNAKEMGNYSISLDVNGEFEEVTLVDRFTGIETNMLLEDEYTFTATSNDNPNRFVIRLDNGQQTTDNGQFVYQSGEELILSIEGHVQIVDMLGRVVYSNEHANGDNRISVSEFNNAAYVVRVINEEGVKTQKVVIY